jgi:hypothetical protein
MGDDVKMKLTGFLVNSGFQSVVWSRKGFIAQSYFGKFQNFSKGARKKFLKVYDLISHNYKGVSIRSAWVPSEAVFSLYLTFSKKPCTSRRGRRFFYGR